MPNFTATRTYTYITGNLIDPVQNNANENEIYNKHNSSVNASAGHGHTGTTGDGPQINDAYIANAINELSAGSSHTVLATDRILIRTVASTAFTFIVPNPYPSTWPQRLLFMDGSLDASKANITVTVNGYGIEQLTGVTQSAYIVEDGGTLEIVRMSSGYWKIV